MKELTATEARQQTIENLHKNMVFDAINCESKLGLFELKMPSEYMSKSIIEYLNEKGYVVEKKEARGGGGGKMFVRTSYRISWVKNN